MRRVPTEMFLVNSLTLSISSRADCSTNARPKHLAHISQGSPSILAILNLQEASMCPAFSLRLRSLMIGPVCRQEKTKLVAEKGKLVEVVERSGIVPNGTAFAVTTGAVPDLDSTHLIVGEIVDGMDLVRKLDQLPVVKNNTNSPFFQVRSPTPDAVPERTEYLRRFECMPTTCHGTGLRSQQWLWPHNEA